MRRRTPERAPCAPYPTPLGQVAKSLPSGYTNLHVISGRAEAGKRRIAAWQGAALLARGGVALHQTAPARAHGGGGGAEGAGSTVRAAAGPPVLGVWIQRPWRSPVQAPR